MQVTLMGRSERATLRTGYPYARWRGVAAGLLLLILFSRISDLPSLDGLPVSVTQTVVGLLFGAMLFDRLIISRQALAWHSLIGFMLLYGAAIAVSMLGATDRLATAAALVAYVREIAIVLLLVNLVTTWADLRIALWSLVLAGTLLAAAGVVQAFTGFDSGGLSTLGIETARNALSVRLDGPVGIDSNEFAQLTGMTVALAICLTWTERRVARLAAVGALGLASAVTMWTFSRGSLVGVGAALGAAILLQHRRPVRLAAVAFVVAAIALGAPGLYWQRLGLTFGDATVVARGQLPAVLVPRVTPSPAPAGAASPSAATLIAEANAQDHPEGAVDATGKPILTRTDDSIFDRSSLLRVGVQMFLDRPLTGVGKGNYLAVYPAYSARIDPALPSTALGPHNTFVQIAAESGLLGLVTFGALLVAAGITFRSVRRGLLAAGREREALLVDGLGLALCVCLVTNLFLNDTVYQRYLWLLLGLLAAADRLRRQRDPRERTADQ